MVELPRPCKEEVKKYINNFDSDEKFNLHTESLNKLFIELFPKNNNLSEILIKCCVLNDFYSTYIRDVVHISKRIYELNIDERLKKGDLSLVNDIATNNINGKTWYFYSFATKYCSHHFPLMYPIYDSYVEKVLMYFKNKDNFYEFKRKDLRNYELFYNILINFQKYYEITEFNLKEIDKYLWTIGKKYL